MESSYKIGSNQRHQMYKSKGSDGFLSSTYLIFFCSVKFVPVTIISSQRLFRFFLNMLFALKITSGIFKDANGVHSHSRNINKKKIYIILIMMLKQTWIQATSANNLKINFTDQNIFSIDVKSPYKVRSRAIKVNSFHGTQKDHQNFHIKEKKVHISCLDFCQKRHFWYLALLIIIVNSIKKDIS